MNIFPLAGNLVHENTILAECLCIETATGYLCKVKYFKINSEIIYSLLGLCFHNCSRKYFMLSLRFTSQTHTLMSLALDTRFFPHGFSMCRLADWGDKGQEVRIGTCFCFKSVEDRKCVLIMSTKEQYYAPFFPILVLSFLQILP